jgi:deoxyadenosine/deoxycytidine kinase
VAQASTHIAVSGLIGAGKTTLVQALAPLLGVQPIIERFEQDPYFDKFYDDPPRWAFPHFTFFVQQNLSDRCRIQQAGLDALQERALLEHLLVFGAEFHARGFLDDTDYALLEQLTRTCDQLVGPSRLLIHIDVSIDEALRRLHKRQRPAESSIAADYLSALASHYPGFLGAWPHGPILRLHASEYDFRDRTSVQLIAQLVKGKLNGEDSAVSSAARHTGGR